MCSQFLNNSNAQVEVDLSFNNLVSINSSTLLTSIVGSRFRDAAQAVDCCEITVPICCDVATATCFSRHRITLHTFFCRIAVAIFWRTISEIGPSRVHPVHTGRVVHLSTWFLYTGDRVSRPSITLSVFSIYSLCVLLRFSVGQIRVARLDNAIPHMLAVSLVRMDLELHATRPIWGSALWYGDVTYVCAGLQVANQFFVNLSGNALTIIGRDALAGYDGVNLGIASAAPPLIPLCTNLVCLSPTLKRHHVFCVFNLSLFPLFACGLQCGCCAVCVCAHRYVWSSVCMLYRMAMLISVSAP